MFMDNGLCMIITEVRVWHFMEKFQKQSYQHLEYRSGLFFLTLTVQVRFAFFLT